MKAEIKEETLDRLSEKVDRPITRGVDKAITEALDKMDSMETEKERKNGDMDITVCDRTEREAENA